MAILCYIHVHMFTWLRYWHGFHFILFYLMVILRSTTGPYGRPMIEVAYGEILFSLYRGCILFSWFFKNKKWLGCRHVVAHVGHTRVNTSVGSTYIIFLIFFKNIKTYMYYVFKSIHVYSIIQKHWWSLILSWPDEVQRTFSTAHWFWRNKVNTTDDFSWV